MRFSKLIKRTGELLLISFFLGAINIIFPYNPGFFKGFFNPYLFLALIIAVYYGKYYGFMSLIISCFVIVLPLPLALELIHPGSTDFPRAEYWKSLKAVSLIPLSLALIGVYIFGIVRDAYESDKKRKQALLKKISREKGLQHRQVKVLKNVNQELEQRVSRQQDSVTVLYSRLQELYSLNYKKALETILEVAQKFSGATSISIWEFKPESKELKLAASAGWETSGQVKTAIPVDNSIEGWVVRNNMMFSVKMLLQYDNLRKMESGRNLMTFPIAAGTKIWGALNIEEMPFFKYNLYTEKLLQMILSLAGPALERAIEYESVIKQAELNPFTGLASFSQFYSLLQQDLRRTVLQKGTLSIIILELINFSALVEEYGKEKMYGMIAQIADELKRLSDSRAGFFHYKDENQLAVLFPNLDYDGASLFCFKTLEAMSGREWQLDRKPLSLEVVLGYAALGGKEMTADEILQVAENILEMQKI
ncbi:hypothetical protein ES703_20475 [subsurface metagenome]